MRRIDVFGFPHGPWGKGPDVEDIERAFPLLHLYQKGMPDSGGFGKNRGGTGSRSLCRAKCPSGVHRHDKELKFPTHTGLFGGYSQTVVPASAWSARVIGKMRRARCRCPTATTIWRRDKPSAGEIKRGAPVARPARIVNEGEIICSSTQGGGGYGDVLERDPEQLMDDIRSNAITARKQCAASSASRSIPETLIQLDEEGTRRRLREEHRERRLSQGSALRRVRGRVGGAPPARSGAQVLRRLAVGGAEPDGRAHLTGRERFAAALGGDGVAFAPYIWERLPEFVHQPAADWWRDANTARRRLLPTPPRSPARTRWSSTRAATPCGRPPPGAAASTSSTASPRPRRRATRSRSWKCSTLRCRSGRWRGCRISTCSSVSLGGRDPEAGEAAEDALSDLARACLEARADALLVMGSDAEAVRVSAARVAGVAEYYGRPLLVAAGQDAWVEGRDGAEVCVLGDDGAWPPLQAGVVLTEDVSGRWDADRLAEVGRRAR